MSVVRALKSVAPPEITMAMISRAAIPFLFVQATELPRVAGDVPISVEIRGAGVAG